MQTFCSFFVIFAHFPFFLSLSSSFYVVYVHYPECHSGSLLRPLVGDPIAALSPAFNAGCPFPRHLMPVVPFGGIFAVRFASPVSLFRPPLPSLCLLRPNLIRTSHPKHHPVFEASNADVAPSHSIYAGFFGAVYLRCYSFWLFMGNLPHNNITA